MSKLDWADNTAVEIIAIALHGPFREAREAIAARLRMARLDGKLEGVQECRTTIKDVFSAERRDLQRECQADHDDAVAGREWTDA